MTTLLETITGVQIIHGANDGRFAGLPGLPVRTVYRSLADPFNIPVNATARVNGVIVGPEHRLADGDVLEFCRRWGMKGTLLGPVDDRDALITLAEATKLLPRKGAGKTTSLDTMYRWCQKGLRGVRLQSKLVGGRRCTTRRWLDTFIEERSNSTVVNRVAAPTVRTQVQRERAANEATRILRAEWGKKILANPSSERS